MNQAIKSLLIIALAIGCVGAGIIAGSKSCYEKYSKEISIGQQVIAIKENEARMIQSMQADFEKAGLCDMGPNVECVWKEGY